MNIYSLITLDASGVLLIVTCFSITFAKIRSRFTYLYDLLKRKIQINIIKKSYNYKASYSVLISDGISNGFLVGNVVV